MEKLSPEVVCDPHFPAPAETLFTDGEESTPSESIA